MTGLAGVNKQPPLKRAATALAHSLTSVLAGLEQRAFSWKSSQRHWGQGARGWSVTAEPTKPHHTIPCHTMQVLPSHPSHPSDVLFLSWPALLVSWNNPLSSHQILLKSNTTVRLDQKKSTWFMTPPSPLSLCPRLGPQLYKDLNQITVWSSCKNRWQAGGWEGWKERVGTSEEAASYEEAAVFWWGCVCVLVCVCLIVPPSLCAEVIGSVIIHWSQNYTD